jgi:hypothetical protein
MFSTYSDEGPLYILIDKSDPSKKYQLHLETSQYMDINDRRVALKYFKDNYKGFFDKLSNIIIENLEKLEDFKDYNIGDPIDSEIYSLLKDDPKFFKRFYDVFYKGKFEDNQYSYINGRLRIGMENLFYIPAEIQEIPDIKQTIKTFIDKVTSKDKYSSDPKGYISRLVGSLYGTDKGSFGSPSKDIDDYLKEAITKSVIDSLEVFLKKNPKFTYPTYEYMFAEVRAIYRILIESYSTYLFNKYKVDDAFLDFYNKAYDIFVDFITKPCFKFSYFV